MLVKRVEAIVDCYFYAHSIFKILKEKKNQNSLRNSNNA